MKCEEQYKILLDTILHNESKRQVANQLYVTLTMAIITAQNLSGRANNTAMFTAFVLIGISTIWLLTIRYHRQLATTKFELLKKIEKNNNISLLCEEWVILKEKKNFISLTRIESILPWVIIIFSVVFILFKIGRAFCNS